MSLRAFLIGSFGLSAILRLHNAWVAPPLSGFDGPYHAANIEIILFQHRVPLAHEGWSTFHPPLYYAVCALIWRILPSEVGPHGLLFAMRLVNVASSLALGAAVYASARLLIPARPWVAAYAAVVALFIPMHMGPSFLLGNEIFAAALSAVAMHLLLRSLADRRSLRLAVLLGLVLGLAALSKFNALVMVATAGATLFHGSWRDRRWRALALRNAVVVGSLVLLVAGWYFVRNVVYYGTPIFVQNDIVTKAMSWQGFGKPRPLGDYFSLRANILLNPSDRSRRTERPVWPATFASVWFDRDGTTMQVKSKWAMRFSRILFVCGGILTGMALTGLVALARRRVTCTIPGGAGALLLLAALSLASYVAFTYRVATFSALKGTYLSPGLIAFAILAGVGLDLTRGWSRHMAVAVPAFLALFALAVTAIFWVGWLAPIQRNPAGTYVSTYIDAPTRHAYNFFVRGRRLGPLPAGGPLRPAPAR